MQTLIPLIIGNTAVAAALAMVAWICSRCGRPALAHAVWLLVIVKLLTPPLWRFELPAAPQLRSAELAAVVPLRAVARESQLPPPARPHAASQAASVPPSTSTPAAEPIRSPAYSPMQLLAGGWVAGSVCVLAIAAIRLVRFRRTLRDAKPPDDALLHDIRNLGLRLHLSRSPLVRVVNEPVSPMLWFIGGRPRLILPRRLLDRMDPKQRAGVIAHELAHLKRRDHWVRLLELPVTIALWWHPLVWMARRGLREAEEQCCDAWAVSVLPDGRRCYADALVDALEMIGRPGLPLAATGLGQLSTLKRRLTMIVTQSPPKSLSFTSRALVVVLFGAVAIAPARGQGDAGGKASPATGAATAPVDDATRQAVLALLEASQDPDANVSQAAKAALLRFGAPAASALIESLDDPKRAQHTILLLAQLGQPAVDELIKALGSRDPIVREYSLQALDQMLMPNDSGFNEMLDPIMMGEEMFAAQPHGTPQKIKLASRLIEPVSKVATDPEPSVRRAAVQLLFKLATIKPDESLVKPLLGALKDDHAQVRSYAAHGLGRLGPTAAQAIDDLAAAVGDPDLSVRHAALDALASMGSQAKAATPAVVAALRSPEPQIRWVAARTLGAMQAPPPPRPPQNPGGFNMMMEDEMMMEGEMMADPAIQSLPGASPAPASNLQPPGI